MNVNKFTINLSDIPNVEGATFNIPIKQGFQLVDQSNIIEKKFVDVEKNNNINNILDYDTTRYSPITTNNLIINLIDNITYKLYFLNNGAYPTNSFYSDLTFTNNDIRLRRNAFNKSFLRLSFYDTDIISTQRLLFFVTLYPKITQNEIQGYTVIPANTFKTHFKVSNNLVDRSLTGEGYFLYYFKDDVGLNLNKELFMRAEFNNAKNGKTTPLMSDNSTTNTIDNLFLTTNGTNIKNKIHTKYVFKSTNNKFYYEIDTNYSDNVEVIGDDYNVKLYEITAI